MTMDARIDLTDDYVLVCTDLPEAPMLTPPDTRVEWAVIRKADGHRMDKGYAPDLAQAQNRAERNLRYILRRQKDRAGE